MARQDIIIGPPGAGQGEYLPEAFGKINANFIELYDGGAAASAEWHSGSGIPESDLGKNGDYYLNTDNGDVYKKELVWVLDGNIRGTPGLTGYTGSVGLQGEKGYSGSQGTQGIQGYFGSTGYTGSLGQTGFTGSIGGLGYFGSTGFVGSRGLQGEQGIQGVSGYTGSKGDLGELGYSGSVGSRGDRGYTGSVGLQGIQGESGVRGFTGSQGNQGTQGVLGYSGSRGFTGSQGTQGQQGILGYAGSVGGQGPRGFTGSVGLQGTQGTTGYTGSVGGQGGQGLRGYSGSQGDSVFTDTGSTVYPSNRRIGIGTNDAKSALHVLGNISVAGGSPAFSTNVYWDGANGRWSHAITGQYGSVFQGRSTGGALIRVASSAGESEGAATVVSSITIDSEGKVGIGGFDPLVQLDVQGFQLIRGVSRLIFSDFASTVDHGGFITTSTAQNTLDIISGMNPGGTGSVGANGIRFGVALGSTWAARARVTSTEIRPEFSGTYDLGTSDHRFRDGYINRLVLRLGPAHAPDNNETVFQQDWNKFSVVHKTLSGVTRSVTLPMSTTGVAFETNLWSYDAIGDGSSADNAAFSNMASALGYIIVPQGSFALNSITISVPIYFRPGAQLVARAGQTITITNVLDSPRQHIFTGSGSFNCVNAKVDVIHPRWFGAVGDGTTNDTVALQRAIDMATSKGTVLLEGNAVYSVTNITLPDSTPFTPTPIPKQWIKGEGNSIIRARSGGDTSYMVACRRWANNVEYPTRGWGFVGVVFDGNSIVQNTFICKMYAGFWNYTTFMGGTQADLHITRANKNNSDGHGGSYLSDNRIIACSFRVSGVTGFKTSGTPSAPTESCTDGHLVACVFDGLVNTSEINIDLATANGWFIHGNHSFGASVASIRLRRLNTPGAFSNNIWAHGVIIDSITGYSNRQIVLGPGNKYWSTVTVGFQNNHNYENVLFRGESFEFDHENPSHFAQLITNTSYTNKGAWVVDCSFMNETPCVKQGSGAPISLRNSMIKGVWTASAAY